MKRPYKARQLSKKVARVVQLMFEHGDGDGKFNRKQLDQDSPGWTGTLPVDFVLATAERMRRTGRFAYEQKWRNGGNEPLENSTVAPKPDELLTREQIAVEIEKSAKKMARKMLTDVLSENAFCPKCGRSLARLFSGIGGGE